RSEFPALETGAMERNAADDWREEAIRQARQLETAAREPVSEFQEFRRKLATGELLSRSAEKLAFALRFSGRITITLHQGRVTKTVLEEAYFPQRTGS
ncbi:MAG: hypothetical protein K6U02_01215, partial [Firmicutes bacterium]|nr:hypothetical protein [Bacillota bacterium]